MAENWDDMIHNLDESFDFDDLGELDDGEFEYTEEMYGASFLPEDQEYDSVVDKIEKISDALAEDIVISNTLEQINNQDDLLGYKQNYIDLFINKYANMWSSIDMLDADDKYVIKDITERLITTILAKIEEKYGVTIGDEIVDYHYLDESLRDLSALYSFFVLRNIQNIIDIFLSDLENDVVMQQFVALLNDEKYQKDLFIQSDLKKGLDPKIAAVTHFTHYIIDTLATNNSDSLYALINRIIKLDLYEETNMRIHEMITDFGNRLQIVENDEEAAKMYFNILYNDTVKAYVANQIITQYLKKHMPPPVEK